MFYDIRIILKLNLSSEYGSTKTNPMKNQILFVYIYMFVLRTIRCKHSRITLKWSPRLMIMIQLPVHKSRGKGRNHRKFISSSLNYYICSKSLKTYISWEEFGVTALKKNENCCLFLCLDDTKLPRTLYTRTGGVCVWYQKHKKYTIWNNL